MTVQTITAEIDRLAAIGNRRKSTEEGARDIARALTGTTGKRQNSTDDALARHLSRYTTKRIRVTRYEVYVGRTRIPLNDPPGDRVIVREFVCSYDDHPRKYRWLREQ